MNTYALIIPSYNGGELFLKALDAISKQSLPLVQKILIDSSSTDDTVLNAKSYGFDVEIINKIDFDHGGTRNYALSKVNAHIVIYLTQDAILASHDSLTNLIHAFENEDVDAVYGRQLPHEGANLLSQYARYSSYKEQSYVTTLKDASPEGFRKAFISNSFSAFRVKSLRTLGGFPSKLILGEDSFIAAKILVSGYCVAYQANAEVYHSHNYTIKEEFKRYFDIGVFHRSQYWMIEQLGNVGSEGLKFAFGQLRFLLKNNAIHLTPYSIFTSAAKFLGYKLGHQHLKFSKSLNQKLSMYNSYFKN
jgi:rhamnosyltransferase